MNQQNLIILKKQREFHEKPTDEIVGVILKLDHLFGKIQLLGILLQRHGEDFIVGDARGETDQIITE